MSMTPAQLQTFDPGTAPYAQAIIDTCAKFAIDDPHEQAMFLAQTAHESGGFKMMRELWGPTPAQAKYGARADLSNTTLAALEFAKAAGVEVGRFYAGHGAIQVTGYANHLSYSRFVYGDDRCAADPKMLTLAPDCILSAGWFWLTRGCGKLADPGDAAAFLAVTRRINGGTNGLEDRQARWAKAQVALGVGE